MKFKYSFQEEVNDNMAKAMGRDLSISTKKSVEIANYLRGKKLSFAKKFLEKVVDLKSAVPMRRFNRDTGHKRAIGPGRYPAKTAKEVLSILKSAESNAISKGLSSNDLIIYHIAAHKASSPWHYGRKRRQKMKRTHLEVVLIEKKDLKDSKKEKTKNNKTESKV
ncbi:MAG: 50S ribosomal protein L22 [Candidatus Woesearchaeota archaeon]